MGHDGDGRCRTKDHALPGEAAKETETETQPKGGKNRSSSYQEMHGSAFYFKVCILFIVTKMQH